MKDKGTAGFNRYLLLGAAASLAVGILYARRNLEEKTPVVSREKARYVSAGPGMREAARERAVKYIENAKLVGAWWN